MGSSGFLEVDGEMASFDSSSQLVEVLTNLDFRQKSRRSAGHKNDQGERYAIQHFLVPLARIGRLLFPLTIEKTERPDFIVTQGATKWGIEVTQTTTTEINRDLARAKSQGSGDFVEYTPSGHNVVKSGDRQSGPGLSGLADCRQIGNLAAAALKRKLETLNKTGFESHSSNILLLLDTYGIPFEGDELPTLLEHIVQAVRAEAINSTTQLEFERICFIENGMLIDDILGSQEIFRYS